MSPKGRILGGTYEVNYCTFKLENHEDEGLSEMIERVVDELVQHKELLQRITNDGGEIEFFIGWFTKGNSGEIFKQSLLQKLSTLGIDLAFDVYNTRRSSS